MDFVLFSDGGGEKTAAAAGACIVEEKTSGRRRRFVLFLGPGTNNEAEISAGLIGFSFIRLLASSRRAGGSVRWVSDSEYVLKSATAYIEVWQRNGWRTAAKKPVKNQGLWQTFLRLSEGIRVIPEHVRGHTGHPENEACDRAATWAQRNAETVFAEREGALEVEIPEAGEAGRWVLLDGREFINGMRSEGSFVPEPRQSLILLESIRSLGVEGFEDGPLAAVPAVGDLTFSEAALLKGLKSLHSEALALSAESSRAAALGNDLSKALKRYTAKGKNRASKG